MATDEAVCGRVPVIRESERKRKMRLQGATVIGAREARISAWLSELAGHTRRRMTGSLATLMRTAPRIERKLSNDESRDALVWARKQVLNKVLEQSRKEIAAQFWIELRTPPADSRPSSWLNELELAWMRAQVIWRRQNERLAAYPARGR